MQTPSPSSGYCAGCGYWLRGLTLEHRCPECGRKFDPDDPKTFRRHPDGRLIRWLAEPIGWPTVILSLLSAAGVLAVSRWQWNTFNPSAVDLVYYLNPSALRHRSSLVTDRDYIFTASMLLAIFIAFWWVARLVMGSFARWRMDWQLDERPVRDGWRHTLILIALFLVATGAALGWPYRLAQQWIALRNSTTVSQAGASFSSFGPPTAPTAAMFPSPLNWPSISTIRFNLSDRQTLATLRAAVIQMRKPRQRTTGLQILVEEQPASALPILTEAVGLESDSQVRALELHLIGMHRDRSTIPLLRSFLRHPDIATRVAATDAIGLVHAPAFDVQSSDDGFPLFGVATNSTPAIGLNNLLPFGGTGNPSGDVIEIDATIRDAMERMMLSGETSGEREAAARALLLWPPENYQLRVAEWGVWIDDGGQLKLVRSMLDEIPPFVHGTGNSVSDFKDRINSITFVNKPIIHITVDKPMAVDINVVINRGRVWFAYPRPDDFAVTVETNYNPRLSPPAPLPALLSSLDNSAEPKLPDIRQGYPWLAPSHPLDGSIESDAGGVNDITGIGLRWQSIIVSPTRLPWMKPPEVGNDPRFAWWKRLREVNSSWVSRRGESDRFLYYDGPTLAPSPVDATLKGNVLRLTPCREPEYHNRKPTDFPTPMVCCAPQSVLLIHRQNGQLSGQAVAYSPTDISLPADDLHDAAVIDVLRKMLCDAGLTADEAEGLVAAWTPQFFGTDGTRTLLIMDRRDYDTLCPMQIRPTPTQWARVGIVVKEF